MPTFPLVTSWTGTAGDGDWTYRALYLSPEHAAALYDVLIPTRHLINASTIVQVPMREVSYWHIELAAHEVILAENLPVESDLENDNRADFARGSIVTLHPFVSAGCHAPCRPIVTQGPVLEQARTMAYPSVVSDGVFIRRHATVA